MTAWDAIIVGAGPAGSALARRLRPQCRVLLLDRDAPSATGLPRIGESLPGAARVLLQRMGVFDRFLADAHAERGATVSQWDSEEPVWFDHLRDPNGPGWHLDRTRFDASLRAAAVAAGAKLIEHCGRLRVSRSDDEWRIDLEARGESHRAPVVVDASGRSANLVRQLDLPRRTDDTLVCLYAHLPADADDDDQCTRVCADRNGWWYSVRVPSGQRVLAFHLDADAPELKSLRDPEQFLAKARQQPLLADAIAASVFEPVTGHVFGPVSAHADVTVHARPAGSTILDLDALADTAPGFFAIGDAAIAFDPIASQGIFHALASSESAARAIEAQLAGAPESRDAYCAEMQAVHARYREHLQATYAGVVRFRNESFWMRRMIGMA